MTCNQCANPAIAKGLCSKHYAQMRMATGTRPRYDFTCITCDKPGDSFDRDTQRHAYCQRVSTYTKSRKLASTTAIAIRPKPIIETPIAKGNIWVAGSCVTCGGNFISSFSDKTCSPTCQVKNRQLIRQEKHARRRAREKNAPRLERFKRRDIFNRDGWICQLCFLPVDPNATDLMEVASLDHVIALANSGSHTVDNVQLAHFLCNSYKRDL